METPKKPDSKSENGHPPATPFPKSKLCHQLGFGTGISVFEMVRSPRVNQFRSPWAVKSIIKKQDKTAVYGKRLLAEADVLKKMKHPNIVGFRKFTEISDGRPCLAMEKCGKSLGDMIEERRENGFLAYPNKQILKMMMDISDALNYIHTEVFLLHGDVKSFNVLVNGDFEICKLCDFGVSLPLDKTGNLDKGKTKQDYIGTGCWAAPEVLYTDDPITSKTDIFSFGLTIWEMMALVLPHCTIETEQSMVTEDSVCSMNESELNDSTELYGTRPAIPDDIDEKEYEDVLSIFLLATEENPDNRPAAGKIYLYVKRVLARLCRETTGARARPFNSYWWNEEIAELVKQQSVYHKRFKRAIKPNKDFPQEAFEEFKKMRRFAKVAIKKRKIELWIDLPFGIEDDISSFFN